MSLLDTTILSYAVGDEHALREPCRKLLEGHAEGRVLASTTVEVIQEFTRVRSRRRSREDAVALPRRYSEALVMLATLPEEMDLGLTLYTRYPALGCFDAVLAALALHRWMEVKVSADRAFGSVASLPWVDPATPALRRLMGG